MRPAVEVVTDALNVKELASPCRPAFALGKRRLAASAKFILNFVFD
jgi:hypothetical protein